VAEAFFHDCQHFLVVAAFGVEDAGGAQARAGEPGREQVAAGQGPEHRPLPAPEPGGDAGEEQGGGGIVGERGPRAGDFMKAGHGDPPARQPAIH
jgi:hypothetical protein